jgi:hypothetical protein
MGGLGLGGGHVFFGKNHRAVTQAPTENIPALRSLGLGGGHVLCDKNLYT